MSKNIKALALALVMLCSLLLAACGGGGTADTTLPSDEAPAAIPGYSVKVVDSFGVPCTDGIIVRFLKDGQQVAMQVVNEEGIAAKELEDGEYTVELATTGDDAIYCDTTGITLTPDSPSAEVTLYNALEGEAVMVYAPSLSGSSYDMAAYNMAEGCTYVSLEAGERNYFFFSPSEQGLYQISVLNSDAVLGYYGVPYFVQNTTITEPVNGIIEVNIKSHMIGEGSTLVFGLDATGADTEAVFAISRIGDALTDAEDVPFEVYKAKTPPTAYTLPAGAKLGEFDPKAATEKYNLVLGDDGFYYLEGEDGKRSPVLVKLGKTPEERDGNIGGSGYLPSLEEMATKALICKYFYDENGEFIRKEAYNECLLEYIECVDKSNGLYPLTEDLKYIIQQRGDHYGWFEEADTKHGYIFKDSNGNIIPNINNEISWLVLCCYIKN